MMAVGMDVRHRGVRDPSFAANAPPDLSARLHPRGANQRSSLDALCSADGAIIGPPGATLSGLSTVNREQVLHHAIGQRLLRTTNGRTRGSRDSRRCRLARVSVAGCRESQALPI